MSCLKCGHGDSYRPPDYKDYHERLYTKRRYLRNRHTDPQMKFILKKLSISPADKVLDVGCGVGDYTKEVYARTTCVTGLDLDITHAQQKNPLISFIRHDCSDPLPFPDRSVDKIIAINVIEHLRDYGSFLSECKRVLKANGCIALTTANLDFFLHDFYFDETHLHEWSLSDFGMMVRSHFSPVVISKSSSMFNYFPFNLVLARLIKPDLIFIGINAN
jgi:SAM-dependent methyltransferase